MADFEDEDAFEQQRVEISSAIASSGDLIGTRSDGFASLRVTFADAPRFAAKIPELEGKYGGMRSVRGDGNCFYRSYLFGCLELAIANGAVMDALIAAVGGSKDKLVALGFSEYIIEDFWETSMDFLEWIKSARPSTEDIRTKLCDDLAVSQYLICYLRFIASFHLQANEDAFSPFLPDGKSIADFVKHEVEPVDHEADQIQCVALVNEIGIPVRIEQLTQADDGPLTHVDLGGDASTTDAQRVCLLFRPGHYDLLYRM